jgi:hypothetical protein
LGQNFVSLIRRVVRNGTLRKLANIYLNQTIDTALAGTNVVLRCRANRSRRNLDLKPNATESVRDSRLPTVELACFERFVATCHLPMRNHDDRVGVIDLAAMLKVI